MDRVVTVSYIVSLLNFVGTNTTAYKVFHLITYLFIYCLFFNHSAVNIHIYVCVCFITELGDNLEGKNDENEVEEMSTFGVSTVNSSKSLLNPPMYGNSEFMQLQQKNEGLVQENNRYFFMLFMYFSAKILV